MHEYYTTRLIRMFRNTQRHMRGVQKVLAYLPLGHLGHGPPLNSEKFLHKPMAKNATLEKFDSQENS